MNFVYMSKCHPVAFFLLLHGTQQPLNPDTVFLHACAWRRRTWGMQPCGNDWPGGWDCPIEISGLFIHFFPLKKPLGGFLLSILVPKWVTWTLSHCTQHCVPISHLYVPHQIFTPTCFSTVFQVSSCSTQLLSSRTLYWFEGRGKVRVRVEQVVFVRAIGIVHHIYTINKSLEVMSS